MDIIILFILFCVVVALVSLMFSEFLLNSGEAAIISRLGRFNRVATHYGINFKIPFIEWIEGKIYTGIRPLNICVKIKIREIFVTYTILLNVYVIKWKIREAFQSGDPTEKITSWVHDLLSERVEYFTREDLMREENLLKIEIEIENLYPQIMYECGYGIKSVSVTDVTLL